VTVRLCAFVRLWLLRAFRQLLDGRFMNHPLEPVNLATNLFQPAAVVSAGGIIAFVLEFFDLGFDGGFVQADHFMMLVGDVEGFRQGSQQLVLMHGAVTLEGVVVAGFGDLAKLGDGLFFEFFERVGHELSFLLQVELRSIQSMALIIQLAGCFFNGSEAGTDTGKCAGSTESGMRARGSVRSYQDCDSSGWAAWRLFQAARHRICKIMLRFGCAFRLQVVQSGPLRGYDHSPSAVPEAGEFR